MTLPIARRASLVSLLALAPLVACAQITDFDVMDTDTDVGSTTTASPPSADDGSSTGADEGPGQTSGTTAPAEPGDQAWVQLWTSEYADVRGLAPMADGGVLVGGSAWENIQSVAALRMYDAAGELSGEWVEEAPERGKIWDLCARPDGGTFGVALDSVNDQQGLDQKLSVLDIDPAGEIVAEYPYEGLLADDYQSTDVLPRVICESTGRASVAMAYRSSEGEPGTPLVVFLAARFDTNGFTGWERSFSDPGIVFFGLVGVGGDSDDNLHMPVVVESPGGGSSELRWVSYDAAGDERPEISLDDSSSIGQSPQLFASGGERAAVVGLDVDADRNWVLVTDVDGQEQWMNEQLPPPSDAWRPRVVRFAEDGSLIIAAWSGQQHEQILSVMVLSPDGEVQWSREYEDLGDPSLDPEHMEVRALSVGPSTIDLGGTVWPDSSGELIYGWIRRVQR